MGAYAQRGITNMINLTYSNISKTPCFECKERKVTHDYNCHAVCEKYIEFQNGRKENNRLALIAAAATDLNLGGGKKNTNV